MLRRTDQRSCPNLRSFRRCCKKLTTFGSSKQYSNSLMLEDSVAFDAAEMVGNSGDMADRVQEVISMLCLEDIADKKLGCDLVALGRGRRRLISIGQELCNRPGLVCMEDPIQDLNWNEAEEVLYQLILLFFKITNLNSLGSFCYRGVVARRPNCDLHSYDADSCNLQLLRHAAASRNWAAALLRPRERSSSILREYRVSAQGQFSISSGISSGHSCREVFLYLFKHYMIIVNLIYNSK